MKKITFSHGSDFEVSAKKQEHLNKMIDGVNETIPFCES